MQKQKQNFNPFSILQTMQQMQQMSTLFGGGGIAGLFGGGAAATTTAAATGAGAAVPMGAAAALETGGAVAAETGVTAATGAAAGGLGAALGPLALAGGMVYNQYQADRADKNAIEGIEVNPDNITQSLGDYSGLRANMGHKMSFDNNIRAEEKMIKLKADILKTQGNQNRKLTGLDSQDQAQDVFSKRVSRLNPYGIPQSIV